jgi:SAM-dependent methyltransferase
LSRNAFTRELPARMPETVVFVASGAVLVVELLGLRLLAPYVGLTLETTTAIIGAVLAGIAAGAALGGRAADSVAPRLLLPVLLAAGGALAIAAVPLVRVLGPPLRGGGDFGGLVLALVALLPPAAVLSAVTPAVAKLQLRSLASTGAVVGRLSAWATAGALAGTFATGFVIVPLLPTDVALYVLGGALLAFALLLGRGGAPWSGSVIGLAIAALALGGAAVAVGVPCDAETRYHCARIDRDPARESGRTLYLEDLKHSYVDLDDPERLEFDYVRWIGDAIDGAAPAGETLDGVFLGGAGFTLPRYLLATRPGSVARVLEVDAELVDLARERLGLLTGPDLRVRIGDARVTLADDPAASADVLVGDAFSARAVPWHLATVEFAREIRRVLRPDGVYALNVIDQPPLKLLRAEAATLLDAFGDVALVAQDLSGGNFVLLASETELPEEVFTTSRGARVLDREAIASLAAGADPLRDLDAPADQLISR